ncbi:MAG TPA: STAS/SEC14 domain-containing protein [Alphaproteobacteria bacterium]
MLELMPAPDHVVAMRLSGTLTGEDIDRATAAVDKALSRHQRIGIYVDAMDFGGMTAEAFAKDLRYGVSRLGQIGRFARAAIVTDKEWLRSIARFEDRILPKIELRCFDADQRDAALAWASEHFEPKPGPRPAALRPIPTTRPDIYAFEWDGSASADDIARLVRQMREEFEKHDAVRVLARIKRFEGFDAAVLAKGELLSFKLRAASKVQRYAIVGGPNWMKRYGVGIGALLGVEMRYFEPDEEDEAWAWIGARPAEPPPEEKSADVAIPMPPPAPSADA